MNLINRVRIFCISKILNIKNNMFNIANSLYIKKLKIRIKGNDNVVRLGADGNISFLNIKIIGNNNVISIGKNFKCSGICKIVVVGSGNNVLLDDDIQVVTQLVIYNLDNSLNCTIKVGKGTSFYKTEISTYDHESSVIIGEDCMFGYDTIVYNTDGHAIYQEGKLINRANSLVCGNHVWCGWGSTILKNSKIADGCIVGKSAVVSGKFDNPHCIIAGIPARVVKENIIWKRDSVNQVLNENE